jgi:formyl-CoA transferase
VAGLPEDERFATNRQRVSAYDALRPFVADRLAAKPRAFWIEGLTRAGVPCGSVRTFDELFADPQLDAREMIAMIEHATIGPLKALGVPVKLSETPGAVRTPPPTLGQHTDAVLRQDLGLTADAVAALRQQKVI